jgi:acetylornithine/succinyldiaminopimelate/putrescine aminotransferase
VSRADILERSAKYLSPHRVEFFRRAGVDLIIGRREGYRVWDIDGRTYWDCHLNGGTYSFGHRHPALLDALMQALDTLDVGNHHFVSAARVDLAQRLAELTPGDLSQTVFSSGGGEAVDVAIRSARWATGRRKVVAIDRGYHGRTGLSGATGDDSSAARFLSDFPQEFIKVPFNDSAGFEAVLAGGDIACAVMETIPATYGFPTPEPDFLARVRAACTANGALYVADEVQTGMSRTGRLWGCETFGVVPDILIAGKALSGGLYPVAAAVLSPQAAGWLADDGWGHVSTFGGAEPGCRVGLAALELAASHATRSRVDQLSALFAKGLQDIAARRPFLRAIRQTGLVIGLECDRADGGLHLMKAAYDHGIWAIVANYDHAVLQFKPGLLLEDAEAHEILDRLDRAVAAAAFCGDKG